MARGQKPRIGTSIIGAKTNVKKVVSNLPALCTPEDMPIPDIIAKSEERLAIWNFICTDLYNRGQLCESHMLTIMSATDLAYRLMYSSSKCDDDEMIQDFFDDEGNYTGTKIAPWFLIYERLTNQLIRLIERLGMSPRDIAYLTSSNNTFIPATSEPKSIESVEVDYFR